MKGSNLAEIICRRHRDSVTRPAIREQRMAGFNTYTYGALDYLSNKFASCLTSSGLASGDRVLIALPLSSELILAHLGALKVGAVILPVSRLRKDFISLQDDHNKPMAVITSHNQMEKSQDLHIILEEAESTFVVTEFVSQNLTDIRLKSFWYEINFANPDHQAADVGTDSLAYLIASGTDNSEIRVEDVTHGDLLSHIQVHEKADSQLRGLNWDETKCGEISRTDLAALYSRLYAGESIEV